MTDGGGPDGGFLAVRGLTRDFGGVRAVDRLDLDLAAGEMLCLIGPNGCGKTTLFNLMTGQLRPTLGTVRFRGADLAGLPRHRIAASGIVRKFQVPSVFATLTVAENLRTALAAPAAAAAGGEAWTVGGLLELVGLDGRRGEPAAALSHGETQWLELAMVVAARPRLMLLDEPTAGMTREETRATARLVRRLRDESGAAMILIEHDMTFVEALDCPVAVMMAGRIVASGRYAEVRRNDAVRHSYLGGGRA